MAGGISKLLRKVARGRYESDEWIVEHHYEFGANRRATHKETGEKRYFGTLREAEYHLGMNHG
jgi:hypothetical protein